MLDSEIEQITQKFEESLYKSHNALAKTYSNQQGEILLRLNHIYERLEGIDKKQAVANGRTKKCEEDIIALKLFHAEEDGQNQVKGKFSSALMSVASSVVAVMILWWIGLRK